MAIKVFNSHEEDAEIARQRQAKETATLQAHALVAALRPAAGKGVPKKGGVPPGRCYKCDQEGHWAQSCPNPRPPRKPCPLCKKAGHWKSDCPGTANSLLAPLRGEGAEASALDLAMLGLADD